MLQIKVKTEMQKLEYHCSFRITKARAGNISSSEHSTWKLRYKVHAENPGENSECLETEKTLLSSTGWVILGHFTKEMVEGKHNDFHI